mgnify:CR=1 FL=1
MVYFWRMGNFDAHLLIQTSVNFNLSNIELPGGSNMTMNRHQVSQTWCVSTCGCIDQQRIDNKHYLMYKITPNLIAYFLMPPARPFQHFLTCPKDWYLLQLFIKISRYFHKLSFLKKNLPMPPFLSKRNRLCY